MTERAIAAKLDRSPNTVHVHVRNIYRKFNVTSRKMLFNVVAKDLRIAQEPKLPNVR